MEKPLLLLSGALLTACAAAHASSSYVSAYDLHSQWQAEQRLASSTASTADGIDANRYTAYVSGVVDALDGASICIPDGVKLGQLVAMVGKYLDDHPDQWNQAASTQVLLSLWPRFPCAKKH
ncbi:Rap1a/Tai family immunity protein [Dokdonella soli]|uniref:Rap1a immunity protein domain-containing protein n=1 Tax=Dokdonella soli TaxID=529810 RepID=A0ABN1IBH8_9GAMM